MNKKWQKQFHPEVQMQVINLIWKNWIPGTIVDEADWEKAREIVWADNALETLIWKQKNLSIGEYQK